MADRYYLIDFAFSSGGTVRVKAKNQAEAWKEVAGGYCQVWDQIAEQINDMRASEFDVKFDKRSMCLDSDQDDPPNTKWDDSLPGE